MIDPVEHLPDSAKHVFDLFAFFTFLLHAVGVALPQVLTAITILWVAVRIYETETVRGLLKRFRKTHD